MDEVNDRQGHTTLVAIASANPVKIRATRRAFRRLLPDLTCEVVSVPVESGVGSQPMSDEQTLRGARRRAEACREARPDAGYWVGIEGGVQTIGDDLATFAWVVVLSSKGEGKGRSGTFFLPDRVAKLVRAGTELGEADDSVFGKTDSKRDNGAVGLLTGDVIDRTGLYEHAVILALIPFRDPSLFRGGTA